MVTNTAPVHSGLAEATNQIILAFSFETDVKNDLKILQEKGATLDKVTACLNLRALESFEGKYACFKNNKEMQAIGKKIHTALIATMKNFDSVQLQNPGVDGGPGGNGKLTSLIDLTTGKPVLTLLQFINNPKDAYGINFTIRNAYSGYGGDKVNWMPGDGLLKYEAYDSAGKMSNGIHIDQSTSQATACTHSETAVTASGNATQWEPYIVVSSSVNDPTQPFDNLNKEMDWN